MLQVFRRVALIPTILVLVTMAIILLLQSVASAAINPQINFQGKLTNPDGTNVASVSYSIVFSMYTVSSGGSAVWTETQNVTPINGVFQVALGSVTSLPGSVDFNSADIYLGVKVGADAEMSPRVRFTSSPYAFNSDKLNGLASNSFVQLAQGIQSDSSTTNASIAINKTGATAKIVDIQKGGAAVFNINNDGSAFFKNQTDSALAFDVQDSAGLNLLTIDSINDRLYVGDSTADGVGFLLVLDNKNTTGETAGMAVNGGMYYNSNENRYRCFRGVNGTVADGDYENCGDNPIDTSFYIDEEFMGGLTTSGNIGKLDWVLNNITTAATVSYPGAFSADRPGIVRLTTPNAGANRGSNMNLTNAALTIAPKLSFKSAASVNTAGPLSGTGQVFRVGFHSGTTTQARPAFGVWWEADTSNTTGNGNVNWQYCYGNGAAAVCASSGIAIVANAYVRLEARVISATAIDYFIDGTKFQVTGITLGTATNVSPVITCSGVSTTTRICNVDYYQLRGGSGTAR